MQQLNKKSNVLDASAFVGASFCRYPVGVLQGRQSLFGTRFALWRQVMAEICTKYPRAREAEQRQDKVNFLYNLLSNSIIAGREDAPKDW